METQEAVGPPVAARVSRPGLVFAVIAVGVVMSNLDTFVVNVALPSIATDLRTSLSSVSWVLNAYAVILAALLVPAGGLAHRFGARNIYLSGILTFTVASAACAAAPSVWCLVGFRVLQAAGAALLIPSSLGLLLAAAPPERRQIYIRGWAAVSGLASALGPALGGLLAQASWHWVFIVNLPIGVAALLAGPKLLLGIGTRGQRTVAQLDVIGAALVAIAIGALTLGVVQSSAWGWGSVRVIGALVAGFVVLGLLAAHASRHPHPVLPPQLLKMPMFGAASTANLLFALPLAAMLLSAVLWTQDLWHYSPLETGLAIAPGPLMVPFFALGAGPFLMKRIGGPALVIAGCAVFAAGIGWWIATLGPHPHYVAAMLPGMLLTGAGIGLTLPTLIGLGLSSVPAHAYFTGSGVITMTRQVGSVLGVAILVAILNAGHRDQVRAFDIGWYFTILMAAMAALASTRLRTAGRSRQ